MAPPIVDPSLADLKSLVLSKCPQIDKSWLDFEAAKSAAAASSEKQTAKERKSHVSTKAKVKQEKYAKECRLLNQSMIGPGAPFAELAHGIRINELSATSSRDGANVPIIRYSRVKDAGLDPDVVVVYYHGGGLWVGEADSEELSCRKLVMSGSNYAVYSVGYRLLPDYAGSVCLSDAIDAWNHVLEWVGSKPKVIIVGSSSGGELASLVAQEAVRKSLKAKVPVPFCGAMLRCPVTSDVWSGPDFVPERVRMLHTTAKPDFYTSIVSDMKRTVPRDGLEKMPLEAAPEILQNMPPTWLQLSTNDVLYSDGLCYAALLRMEGRRVAMDIVHNFPHTFWLLAPHLPRAATADKAMLEGLEWLLAQTPPPRG
ncbi:hypothetical protein TD95_001215 [Thielaviopsis punctulata]|uniref:Alpha/beta hydrolase fold-3 domain-containing protein n=1 Tax=Thielaviopsis punctulata TaxID=72032 RepID=A0A0F4ZBQ7_9PEZI|nr:hypothetical protein TD95_001215 [Thielaviopsis punctulata]